jgi:phosphoribosylpyrophosphate synthetase
MKHTKLFEEWIIEGIGKEGAEYIFNWQMDSPTDIMSLKLKPFRGRPLPVKNSECTVTNFYAYDIQRSEHSVDLLKDIKSLEDTINRNDSQLLVNKAVLAFDRQFDISKFSAVISIESSSKILAELNQQIQKKSGNIELFSEAFVKNAATDITIDQAAYDKLPPQSKEKIDQSLKLARTSPQGFKMKSVGPQYRSFFQNFIKFNKEEDRHLFNVVNGQRVIIVDDYKTSGSTVKEMIRQLSDAGASEIVVFILVRLGK